MKHLAKIDVPLYLRNKHASKAKRHNHRLWKKKQQDIAANQSGLNEFGQDSKVIAMLKTGKAKHSSRDQKRGHVIFSAPEKFSMLEAPENTLQAIKKFADDLTLPKIRKVEINLGRVKSHDLAANALLDIVVDEINTKARVNRRKIKWKGSYPVDKQQKRLVKSLGVIKFLEVKHEYAPPKEAEKVDAFHARSKHYQRLVRPNEIDKKSKETKKFAEHVDKCLGRVGKKLTDVARQKLCAYVGEVLDNAEEHAGMPDWTIQGYLDSSAEQLMCELVILNFGKSISETILELPVSSYTQNMIARYFQEHSKGLFGIGWAAEDLATLIALQGSVSSKNASEKDTRGNGTVDLIEFFQKIYKECQCSTASKSQAQMMLLSASTVILFDGKYAMKSDGQSPNVIAFNDDNDLLKPPDRNYVKNLGPMAFPGTVLSIKFPISSQSSTPVTESSAA